MGFVATMAMATRDDRYRADLLAAEVELLVRGSSSWSLQGREEDRHALFDALRGLLSRLSVEDLEDSTVVLEALETCKASLSDPKVKGRVDRDICASCEAIFHRRVGRGSIHSDTNALLDAVARKPAGNGLERERTWVRLAAMADVNGKELGSAMSEIARTAVIQLPKESSSGKRAALRALKSALRGREIRQGTIPGDGRLELEEDIFSRGYKVLERLGRDPDVLVRAAVGEVYNSLVMCGTFGRWKKTSNVERFLSSVATMLGDPIMYIRKLAGRAMGKACAYLNEEHRVAFMTQKTKGQGQHGSAGGPIEQLVVEAALGEQRHMMLGLTESWINFVRELSLLARGDFSGEEALKQHSIQAIKLLSVVSSKFERRKGCSLPIPHTQACIQYMVYVGVITRLSEQGQLDLLQKIVHLISPEEDPPLSLCMVALKLVERLLSMLGELPSDVGDATYFHVISLLSHDSAFVRVQAAITASYVVLISPHTAAKRLDERLCKFSQSRLKISKIKDGDPTLVKALHEFQGNGFAVSALLSASKDFMYGLPSSIVRRGIDVAVNCITKPMTSASGIASLISTEREAGFGIFASVASCAPGILLEKKGTKFLKFWTTSFSHECMQALHTWKEDPVVLAWELHWRGSALEALPAFVRCWENFESPDYANSMKEKIQQVIVNAMSIGTNPEIRKSLNASAAKDRLGRSVQVYFLQLLRCFQKLSLLREKGCSHHFMVHTMAPLVHFDESPCSGLASSNLRDVLDVEDCVLGPLYPGTSALEDELEAFVGGNDGPLPCIWEWDSAQEISKPGVAYFFALQDTMANALVTEQMKSLALMFLHVGKDRQVEICTTLQAAVSQVKSRSKSEHHLAQRASVIRNVSYAAVLILKAIPRNFSDDNMARFFHGLADSIFQEGIRKQSCVHLLRTSAELHALAACVASVGPASSYIQSLCEQISVPTLSSTERATLCLVLGRAFDKIGGMQLSYSVPAATAGLLQCSRELSHGDHIWALHALWLTARGAGLVFIKHVKETLDLCLDVLQSHEQEHPVLSHACAMLATASVQVLGPEFKPGTWSFRRCCNLIDQAAGTEEIGPSSELEQVLFIQQLILFAPEYVNPSVDLPILLMSLKSLQPVLRSAVVTTLRQIVEAHAMMVVSFFIEEELFVALDGESDGVILGTIECTLLALLDAGAPASPSRWLDLCARFMFSVNNEKQKENMASEISEDLAREEEEAEDRLTASSAAEITLSNEKPAQSNSSIRMVAPRLRTRKFAASCLKRMLICCSKEQRHLVPSRASSRSQEIDPDDRRDDTFVRQLQMAIDIGYKASTGGLLMLQAQGLDFLYHIVLTFQNVSDPDAEDQGILVQHQAQFLSAIRSALAASVMHPYSIIMGLRLGAAFITCGIAGEDRGALGRVLNMLKRAFLHILNNERMHDSMYCEEVCFGLKEAAASCFCDIFHVLDGTSEAQGARQSEALKQYLEDMIKDIYPQLLQLWLNVLRMQMDTNVRVSQEDNLSKQDFYSSEAEVSLPRLLHCCCSLTHRVKHEVFVGCFEEMVSLCFQAIEQFSLHESETSRDIVLLSLIALFEGQDAKPYYSSFPIIGDVLDVIVWLGSAEQNADTTCSVLCKLLHQICQSQISWDESHIDQVVSGSCMMLQVVQRCTLTGKGLEEAIQHLIECFKFIATQPGQDGALDALLLWSVELCLSDRTRPDFSEELLIAMRTLVCSMEESISQSAMQEAMKTLGRKIQESGERCKGLQHALILMLCIGNCLPEQDAHRHFLLLLSTKDSFQSSLFSSALFEFLKVSGTVQKRWCTSSVTFYYLLFVLKSLLQILCSMDSTDTSAGALQSAVDGMKCAMLCFTFLTGSAHEQKFGSFLLRLLIEISSSVQAKHHTALKLASSSLLMHLIGRGESCIKKSVLELSPAAKIRLQEIVQGSGNSLGKPQEGISEPKKPSIQLKTSFAL